MDRSPHHMQRSLDSICLPWYDMYILHIAVRSRLSRIQLLNKGRKPAGPTLLKVEWIRRGLTGSATNITIYNDDAYMNFTYHCTKHFDQSSGDEFAFKLSPEEWVPLMFVVGNLSNSSYPSFMLATKLKEGLIDRKLTWPYNHGRSINFLIHGLLNLVFSQTAFLFIHINFWRT